LIQNIGYLSSVYCKQPEDFVKKLKDNANAREVVEEDAEELLGKNQEVAEEVDPNRQVSFANQQIEALNTPSQVAYEPEQIMVNKQEQNLLDIMGGDTVIPQQPVQQPVYVTNNNLIDIMEAPIAQQPVMQPIIQPVIQ
jgi:hypothetical protein